MNPLLILAIGVAVVLGMILVLRLNAFFALITAALVVSLLAPGEPGDKVERVIAAFGETAGKIGIAIAMAAVIGSCLTVSGAADRVVQASLRLFGEKRGSAALASSGFILAVPVFFDTVFYLLVPLARSMYRRTNKNYLKYLLAIGVGGAVAHTLVPPTPGPLLMADQLGVDMGLMILIGAAVGLPSVVVGLLFGGWLDSRMTLKTLPGEAEAGTAEAEELPLPGLALSLLPILLPVVLIATNTIVTQLAKTEVAEKIAASTAEGFIGGSAAGPSVAGLMATLGAARYIADGGLDQGWSLAANWTSLIGNPNLALLLSAAIALVLYTRQCKPTSSQRSELVEHALMSAGVIILITAAGGAFGGMLKTANVGTAIEGMFKTEGSASGFAILWLGFAMASLLKLSQGSSTVAMITGSAIIAAMIEGQPLDFHPVYLATAIGCGSIVGVWMNDSGFWIFCKMGGLTETEALKCWSTVLALCGVVGMLVTVAMAMGLPLTPATPAG